MSFARVRALVVIGALGLAAIVFVIVALVRDTQGGAVAGDKCPPGSVMANLALPNDPSEVTIKVLNGTSTAGLAENVTNDFKNRRFQVLKPDEDKKRVTDVAVIRYGPDAVGAVQLLRAYFLDQAELEYNAKRKGAVIDIVVGSGFRQLATSTEVNQSLIEVGQPEAPPGACPAPVKKNK
ncbi:LytR cell envelope-related transcriptional attenuator [Krasilnikovia cinnamomea]|uniref:LytR cell envelope-related transcriptional attenuator n=1 Tax=Krasilnikovia cinnamomea TaxID=349313 RepID=A0A4Q7ZHF1_9ACTN|nr:LytR C-terminal domain-containing protein [Krasilnikovia cinnamomea]RZU49605.1 LytR cell envelope-related transcriptional attenuator [Krasilnikovia cinnamomea]